MDSFQNGGIQHSIADYNLNHGVTKTSCHLYRHTFGRRYAANGGNAFKLQKLFNHKTIDMAKQYVELACEDLEKDIDILNPLETFLRKNK